MTTVTTTGAATVRFTLETSAGTREWCCLCDGLIDKLEHASYAALGGEDQCPVLICLKCAALGEEHLRELVEQSVARHRRQLAWLNAQTGLDASQFEAEVAQAKRAAAELTDHIAADEVFLAAAWNVPTPKDIAEYLAADYRYWAEQDPRFGAASDAEDTTNRIRELTGITVTF